VIPGAVSPDRANRYTAVMQAGSRALIVCLLLPVFMFGAPAVRRSRAAPAVRLRSILADPATGIARAVVVEEGALVHTALMFPEDREGRLQGGADAGAQAARVLVNIELALKEARTTLDHLVRLHVYVADHSVTPKIDALLAERFGGRETKPAVTFVETAMPRPGVLVMMDAIAATAWIPETPGVSRLAAAALPRRTARASHAAIQPAGRFVVVSGRAAGGEFEPAIRETLAQLRRDLESVGLTFSDVVQIKSFLGEMRSAQRLEEVVADAFGDTSVPPQVVTGARLEGVPAEIELVASATRTAGSRAAVEDVEHLEPVSGRYSRVAVVNGGRPVFISGLYGASADPGAQVDEMFAELQRVLHSAGSDMQRLVKATYYVADSAADDRINAVRPGIYGAQRPPAASKLLVRGTGRAGRASTFDMIAVTAAR
jgi:enamine deaminase RidA (YjgF/YER057c/UK114 family)